MTLIRPYCVLIVLIAGFLSHILVPTVVHAQMAMDGSLGTKATLTGPNYTIGHELGQIRGSNLFHSFAQFNVLTGESATFTGPNGIANVLSRVTGGRQSIVDGLLRSQIPGANLYLMNPSGVVFGPNATLDVSGSFHVSTADYLRFADGAKFFTNLQRESVLTSAQPAAFGFLGPNVAPIFVQGSLLQVPNGATLSAMGGDIQITGSTLFAPSGRVQIASVASAGEAAPTGTGTAADLRLDGFGQLGRIIISDSAVRKMKSVSPSTKLSGT